MFYLNYILKLYGVIKMGFKIKTTKKKIPSTYKSLYIRDDLVKKIELIAKMNNTSFNNVIISMIESCLEEYFNENETEEKENK